MTTPTVEFSSHQHGKSRVRVGRVWREGAVHHLAEWNVNVSLFSDTQEAYTDGDNSKLVATDTMKNTVYVIAKACPQRLSAEAFALKLAAHFVSTYPSVHSALISITEKPWERAIVQGKPHDHGYKLGCEQHTVEVKLDAKGNQTVVSGVQELALLKTTQSGFEGFIKDNYTVLPETRERMVASSIRAAWRWSGKPECYSAAYTAVKNILSEKFLGPPSGGEYSPSVQNALYLMARAVLERIPEIESIYLNMPNLHFLPVNLPSAGLHFADDVYLPTSEPHGTIEATLTRSQLGGRQSRL